MVISLRFGKRDIFPPTRCPINSRSGASCRYLSLIFISCLFLFYPLAFTQTTTGQIINAAGQGVRGISIGLSLNKRVTETDTAGYFSFNFDVEGIRPLSDAPSPTSLGLFFFDNQLLTRHKGKLYSLTGQFKRDFSTARLHSSSRAVNTRSKQAAPSEPITPDYLTISTMGYYRQITVNPREPNLGNIYLYNPEEMEPQKFEKMFCWEILRRYSFYQENVPNDPDTISNIKSMYTDLKDPYTKYYDYKSSAQIINALSNKRIGIGVQLDSVTLGYKIDYVMSNSPAQDAGLLRGDIIMSLNNTPVAGTTWSRFITMIQGEVGEQRRIKLDRNGLLLELTVILRKFVFPSVYDYLTDTDSLPYVKITGFFSETVGEGGTASELQNALKKYPTEKPTIIDLRGNGGGAVSECVKVVSEFVPPGTKVAKFTQWEYNADISNGEYIDTIYTTSSPGNSVNRKIYILMDSNSASASEVFISCMMDNRPDIVCVGTKSYGKARGQIITITPMAGLAKVTYSTLRPIKSPPYDQIGITPHISINPGEDAYEVVARLILPQDSVTAKRSASSSARPRLGSKVPALQSSGPPWLLMD